VNEVVRVTTLVAASPAVAFEAFTAEVDAWWRRGPRFRFDPERTGVMRFEPGVGGRLVEVYDPASGDVFEVGRIRAWEPGRRLVFGWRSRAVEEQHATEVEVSFEAEGEGTRVTVEHRGFERLPVDHPARHGLQGPAFVGMHTAWWGDQLVSARALMAGR
jgi:uncharacterized protein YndB with AHSA1/START domain